MRLASCAALIAAALVAMTAGAGAQTAKSLDDIAAVGQNGKQFACMDGSLMTLDFRPAHGSVDALVVVHNHLYRLPASPSLGGMTQVRWSDGDNSLTWSPGVQLMWMSTSDHLMCGNHHNH